MLYVPDEAEVPKHCVESVLRIREFLTVQLSRGGLPDDVAGALRAMRAAARKFLDATDLEQLDTELGWQSHMIGSAGWRFNQALGELRGVFGIHIARLAVAYGIDVEEPLVSVLPLDPDVDEDESMPAAHPRRLARDPRHARETNAAEHRARQRHVALEREMRTRAAAPAAYVVGGIDPAVSALSAESASATTSAVLARSCGGGSASA